MSLVVDASVLVAAAVDSSALGRWAEELVRSRPLVAPELALVEATNILRRLELSSELSRFEATAAHQELLRFPIDLMPFAPFAERVWDLRANLTSYDAWYVAVAEGLELPLATIDRRLTRASGPRCSFIVPGSAATD